MNDISVTYSRSSGPGGQNVNRVDTKVDLRFHLETAEWISEAVREKMAIHVRLGTSSLNESHCDRLFSISV